MDNYEILEFQVNFFFVPRKTRAYKFHPHDQDIWLHLERSRVVEWLRDHSYITKHWIGWVGSEIGHFCLQTVHKQ